MRMKRLYMALAGLAALLAIPSSSQAQAQQDPEKKAAAPEQRAEGKIEKVDTAQRTITLAPPTEKAPLKLHVDNATQIMIQGKRASLSDLKEGQEVRASYELKAGRLYATSITAAKPAAPGAKSDDQPQAEQPGAQQEQPQADSKEQSGAMGESQAGRLKEAQGKVEKVDPMKSTLTVQQPAGKPLTLNVDKSTTIFIEGRTGTLQDLKEGQEVRASYELRDGTNHAQWIEVSKTGAKPEQKAGEKQQPSGKERQPSPY